MSSNQSSGVTVGSLGIPSVVVGVLIALKKVGMTTMSYEDIIWFGIQVFCVCAIIAIVIWLVVLLIIAMISAIK